MIETLKEYLEHHKVNKTAFAKKVGISKQHLHRILKTGKCSKAIAEKLSSVIEKQEQRQALSELQNQITDLTEALTKDFKLLFRLSKDRYAEYEHFLNGSELREFSKTLKDNNPNS